MPGNTNTSPALAFLGMGVMGAPMAGHLLAAGYRVTVYNRSTEKAEAWIQKQQSEASSVSHAAHASVATTVAEAVADADMVFSCLGADEDVLGVFDGADGVLANAKAGALLVDHTTTSAELARQLDAKARERGLGFVDAPVSGGQAGAENGLLTVMCGGSEADVAKAEPVMQAYAQKISRLGEAGSGQLCKMVNQICITGLLQSLAEGLNFAGRAGLDQKAVMEVISKGAAQSWQMENRHGTMIDGDYDFGFAVDWMRKDLKYALEEGRRNGSELVVAEMVDGYYADVQALGGSRWDTSSLMARLLDRADKN